MEITSISVYENCVDECLWKLRRLMFMKVTSINVDENEVDLSF